MDNYTFTVTLIDYALPYPSMESAKKDAEEWAKEIAVTENCIVGEVKVTKEVD